MNNTSTLNEGSYSDHGSGHKKNDINAYKRVPLLRSTRCLLKISGCSEMQTDTNECCVEAKPLNSFRMTLTLERAFVHLRLTGQIQIPVLAPGVRSMKKIASLLHEGN